MALNPLNSSDLEQLTLKGLMLRTACELKLTAAHNQKYRSYHSLYDSSVTRSLFHCRRSQLTSSALLDRTTQLQVTNRSNAVKCALRTFALQLCRSAVIRLSAGDRPITEQK